MHEAAACARVRYHLVVFSMIVHTAVTSRRWPVPMPAHMRPVLAPFTSGGLWLHRIIACGLSSKTSQQLLQPCFAQFAGLSPLP